MRTIATKRAFTVCAAVAVTTLVVDVGFAPAARPRVISWAITPHVTAGARPTASYKLTLPRGDVAVLEQLDGKTWRSVTVLKVSRYGTGIVRGWRLAPGRYYLRIAILGRRHTLIGASQVAGVSATAAPPSVSWTFPTTANAGGAIPFAWTAKGLTEGGKVVVQQAEGTAKTWRTIATLKGGSGTSSVAALGTGRNYRFRIAVLSSHGTVLADQTTFVDVYGEVSLNDLLGNSSAGPGTYTSPTNTFSYVDYTGEWDINQTVQTQYSVTAHSNDCKVVHIDFIEGSDPDYWPNNATNLQTVTVAQQSQNPVSVSSAFNVPSAVNATLIPGQSWAVTIALSGQAQDDFFYGPYVYFNGYGTCDSTAAIINQ